MTVTLHLGDCLDVLRSMPAASVDALVTDPPYDLVEPRSSPSLSRVMANGRTDDEKRARRGFMGKNWDGTGIAFRVDFWREALRVLKPGAHLLAFGGTRTHHRMAIAVEDAGFEIRDCLLWLHGQGFPKSHNLHGEYEGWGTALKPAYEPIVLARAPLSEPTVAANVARWSTGALNIDACRISTTDTPHKPGPNGGMGGDAWRGMEGRADRLGVQYEPHTRGRWPANLILSHTLFCSPRGTARVKGGNGVRGRGGSVYGGGNGYTTDFGEVGQTVGYADADGLEEVEIWDCPPDCPVAMLDAQSGESRGTDRIGPPGGRTFGGGPMKAEVGQWYGDTGGASRFFFVAKASRAEREAWLGPSLFDPGLGEQTVGDGRTTPIDNPYQRGETKRRNVHPTVKPVALMRYLVRLVCPPDGVVLDPFMGSGSTGLACQAEGFGFVGIERESDYLEIARRRLGLTVEVAGA